MIVALSPHLDDAVFSCGGYLATREDEDRLIVTTFTRSVPDPTGFALACQLDKGLDAGVDYMALRRAEDKRAAGILGCRVEHWDLPEAPHRGYGSAEALFTGPLTGDAYIVAELTRRLAVCLRRWKPRLVLFPAGVGHHVDHLQLVQSVQRVIPGFPETRFVRYLDQPYTNKHGDWRALEAYSPRVITLGEAEVQRKLAACRAYSTQVGFQFGGADRVGEVLGREEYVVV